MCSEFHDWRCAIAQAAGYDIEEDWDGGRAILDWDTITRDNVVGNWPTPPADPLLVLLAHTDIEGTIAPSDALRLADRLNELLIPSRWRGVTEKFIRACRLSAYRNEPMEFVWDPAAMIERLMMDALHQKLVAAALDV